MAETMQSRHGQQAVARVSACTDVATYPAAMEVRRTLIDGPCRGENGAERWYCSALEPSLFPKDCRHHQRLLNAYDIMNLHHFKLTETIVRLP